MKNGVCPHCNSTDIYMTDFSSLQAGDSLVRPEHLREHGDSEQIFSISHVFPQPVE